MLLRLSLAAHGKPLKPPQVQKDLAAVLPEQATEAALATAREELVAAGLAEVFVPPPKASKAKKLPATPPAPPLADPSVIEATTAGRSAAAALLQVEAIPPINWTKLQSQFLLPLAMGLPAGSKPPTAAKLVPTLVTRQLGLKPGLTPGKLLEAIAFRELGFPDIGSWKELQAAALNRLLSRTTGQSVNLAGKQLESQVPLAVLGVSRAAPEVIKAKVLRDWLAKKPRSSESGGVEERSSPDRHQPTPPLADARGSFNLTDFAHRVTDAARNVPPAGWFGQNKVYINHAWRRFNADNDGNATDLATFKSQLIDAHRGGLLTLSRADLVAAMNADDVAESEARYLNGQFHFILLEGERL